MDVSFPTKIHFSENALDSIVANIVHNFSSCVLVTGGVKTKSSRLFGDIKNLLQANVSNLLVVEGVHSNPREEEIVEAANEIKRFRPDCIISVGAGSVHDAAKILSVLATQDSSIEELTVEQQGYNKIKIGLLPLFCIPLIVGTGAEISPASLIRIKQQKRIIFSPHLYPKAAYYSFQHIGSDDDELNILTAFDAFIHSLESFTSRKSNLWSEMYALAGLKNSLEGIHKLSISGASSGVWNQLSHASSQSLLAVANSSVGAIHALSDPLSGIYDIHHGRALALVASSITSINYNNCAERYHIVEDLISTTTGLSRSIKLPDAIECLLDKVAPNRKIGIPTIDLSDQGVSKLVTDSKNPDMDGTPRPLNDHQIEAVFRSI
jgi:alcohol dehydrogenase class IV